MAQPGYKSCAGCGRIFKETDPAEITVLHTHDCDWSDEKLDSEITKIARSINDEM